MSLFIQTLLSLLPVGFETDSQPAVEGLVKCGWAGELFDVGVVIEVPRPRKLVVKVVGLRRPLLVSLDRAGETGE